MFKKIFAVFLITAVAMHCVAQEDIPRIKKFNHYAGFQANELLRQLISLNSNPTAVNNPYLGVYSISLAKSAWGAHVGIGYTYRKIQNKGEPVGRETKTNDLFYRIGIERRFSIGKKFEASASFDYVAARQLDKTFSITVTNLGSSIDSSISTVSGKTTTNGFGPRLSLSYHITERLILATEATMYYTSQKQKENILVNDIVTDLFNNNNQTISTSNFNSELDTDGFSFTIPVSLFLIVKF